MTEESSRGLPEAILALFDQLPAMVAYWDASQRCRFANAAYEQWFGVRPEGLIGKHIRELLGGLYPKNRPYIEGALRGEPQRFQRTIPDPAGGPARHSLAHYIPDVADGRVRGFLAHVVDVSELKRTQRALEESESRFSRTIDEAPIGMALVGPDGRFLRVNRVLCEIVGYPAEELMRLTFQQITHPDDLAADVALMGRLERGEIARYQLEKRYLRKDGAVIEVLLHGSPVRGADGQLLHYVAQIQDITERKKLEGRLRLAEATSSGILAISADAIISVDADQRITLFNEGASEIFGYSREEATGAPLDLLIPARFREAHRGHVARFGAGPGPQSRLMGARGAEIYGLRKSGEEFPAEAAISRLEVEGRRILTVALRDVTFQRRQEADQRFLAAAGLFLGSSLDYEKTLGRIAELAVTGFADLCIVEVVEEDGTLRRLKVVSRDPGQREVCEGLSKVKLDRARPHLFTDVLRSRRASVRQFESEAELAALAQGEEHRKLLVAAGIRSMVAVPLIGGGQLLGAIALMSSTSRRQYGEPELRIAEELARRASLSIVNARLYREAQAATAARDDILGVVAHDLRNPLQLIRLQTQLLRGRKPGENGEGARKAAERVEHAARRMQRLIDDLLDVAQFEARGMSVQPLRLSTPRIIDEAVEDQRPNARAGSVELRVDVTSGVSDVLADRDRLLQVLENLIGNALKFTAEGGVITVRARPGEGEVVFSVSDTGVGIPPDQLAHLFDRFWQPRAERSRRRGAGLGLAIVKAVVESHGGHLWVESEPQRGSTFFFTLPSAPPESQGAGAAP